MFKHLCAALALAIFLLGLSAETANAVEYKKELTRTTGTNWGFPGYKVEYEVSNTKVAEVIKAPDGQYRVHLKQPGDVVVTVTFFNGGKKLPPEYYLFHVVGQAVDDTSFQWGEFAVKVIRLTNEERKKFGLKELKPAFDLSQSAAIRVEEASRVFSHKRPDGSDFHTVLTIPYQSAGENLQAGAATPEEVVKAWMNSPSHRENILSDEYEELAVGYIYVPESRYRHYWAQIFLTR